MAGAARSRVAIASLCLLAACRRAPPPPGQVEVVAPPFDAGAPPPVGPPPPSAGSTSGSPVHVAVRSGARSADLVHAIAHVHAGAIVVSLTGAPVSCAVWPTPPTPYLSFTIPRGPGDRYFAGSTVGLEAFVRFGDSDGDLLGPEATAFTIDAITSRRSVKGSLAISATPSSASGTFEVEVCPESSLPDEPDEARRRPLAVSAAPGPLTTTYAGTAVTVASASLRLAGEDAGGRYADELFITFKTPPTLGSEPLERDVELEMVVSLKGARGEKQRAIMEKPQPVQFRLTGRGNWGHYRGRGLPAPAWTGSGPGWIRFSTVGFAPGAPFVAELVAEGTGRTPLGVTSVTGTVRGKAQ